MAFINVAEWTPHNVVNWLQGLEDSILPYIPFFLNNGINGCRLLLLSTDDLNNLNVTKIGHQEIILDGVDLLKHLHYNFRSETLQSLALRLGCKSRSLFNQLQQETSDINNKSKIDRVSTKTLSGVCEILTAVKSFISWIDRYPFEGQDQYIPVRKTILKLSIELASTSQRDQFVETPNEVIKANCSSFADICDRIVQKLSDSLAIQPACLDVVTIKKKCDEELGMHIHSSYSGIHVVGGVKFQSPAHRCGRIEEGDEIVQINYQTVVGWQLKRLVNAMKEYPTEITLTIKKRPRHSNLLGQVTVLKPYKIPNRKPSSQGNRVKNASTATGNSENDSQYIKERTSKQYQVKGPTYQISSRKSKSSVRRRATISGASPTSRLPPIRIEDLLTNKNHHRNLSSRNSSQDSSFDTRSESNQKVKPIPPQKSSSTSQVPYAKVHPLLVGDNFLQSKEKQTVPKQRLSSSLSNPNEIKSSSEFDLEPKDENQINSDSNLKNNFIHDSFPDVIKLNHVSSKNNNLKLSYNDNHNNNHASTNSPCYISKEECHKNEPSVRIIDMKEKPFLPKKTFKLQQVKATRQNSCKDLGQADYQGWLYQKKDFQGYLSSGSSWFKRWMMLKRDYFYCFHNPDSPKAYCLIHLPSFKVSPTSDCKTKDHTFKVFNFRTVFHFASDTASEMNEWIKKLNFASVFSKKFDSLSSENCFSESDESGSESFLSYAQRSISVEENLKSLSKSLSTTSLNDRSACKSDLLLTHNSAQNISNETNQQSFSNQNVDDVDSTRQPICPKESTYPYAQLAFPPPSPLQAKNSPPFPKIPPKSGKYLTLSTTTPPALPPRPEAKIGLVTVSSLNNVGVKIKKLDELDANDSNNSKKPTPQPRTSKLKSLSAENQEKSTHSTLINSDSYVNKSLKTFENPLYIRAQEISSVQCLSNSNKDDIYVSFLDKEYNKLFGNKSSNDEIIVPSSSKPKSATSEEIASLYTLKLPLTSKRSIDSDLTSSEKSNGLSINRSISSTKSDRSCNSPISDNSFSSSSGISSYYSTHIESALDNKANPSLYSPSSSIPSHSSSLSTSAVDDATQGSSKLMTLKEPISSSNDNGKYLPFLEKSYDQEKSLKCPSSKSTFRLFSSPKLLKKFSTPKYQKERDLERKDGGSKLLEENRSSESKLIIPSPPLTRTIFGIIGKRNITAYDNNAMETESDLPLSFDESSSESSLSSSFSSSLTNSKLERKKEKPDIKITIPTRNEQINYFSDCNLSPGTPKKPTMGIAMIGKKRSMSNVSNDKNAIETALAAFKREYSNANLSCSVQGSFTIENDWANVIKIIEELGFTLEKIVTQDELNVELNKPLDDESVCKLVLNLRDLQKNLKDDQILEIDAINELLEEPITLPKLKQWLQKYSNIFLNDALQK